MHKSVAEIKQLTVSEITGWVAYFSLDNDAEPAKNDPDQEYKQLKKVLG